MTNFSVRAFSLLIATASLNLFCLAQNAPPPNRSRLEPSKQGVSHCRFCQPYQRMPTVVTIYLDRPAILTNVKDKVAAMVGNFGVSDAALFDALTGKVAPRGKLPFALPSSMEAVKAQAEDTPHDSKALLYNFGFGLNYAGLKTKGAKQRQ